MERSSRTHLSWFPWGRDGGGRQLLIKSDMCNFVQSSSSGKSRKFAICLLYSKPRWFLSLFYKITIDCRSIEVETLGILYKLPPQTYISLDHISWNFQFVCGTRYNMHSITHESMKEHIPNGGKSMLVVGTSRTLCKTLRYISAALWQNQQNGLCAQQRLRSAWASAHFDQSLHCAQLRAQCLFVCLFFHADSEDADQTGRMPRLIWVFAGRTVILLVLSWSGSFVIHMRYSRVFMILSSSLVVWDLYINYFTDTLLQGRCIVYHAGPHCRCGNLLNLLFYFQKVFVYTRLWWSQTIEERWVNCLSVKSYRGHYMTLRILADWRLTRWLLMIIYNRPVFVNSISGPLLLTASAQSDQSLRCPHEETLGP